MNKKSSFFGLDVGTRNFEVLGRILASILGVLGRSWGRLGASWAPLRSSWAPLWRQSPYTKAATPPNEKNSKTKGPKIRDRRHGDFDLWGPGKTADSEKSIAKVSLNTEENANPAKWREHGVNQGR